MLYLWQAYRQWLTGDRDCTGNVVAGTRCEQASTISWYRSLSFIVNYCEFERKVPCKTSNSSSSFILSGETFLIAEFEAFEIFLQIPSMIPCMHEWSYSCCTHFIMSSCMSHRDMQIHQTFNESYLVCMVLVVYIRNIRANREFLNMYRNLETHIYEDVNCWVIKFDNIGHAWNVSSSTTSPFHDHEPWMTMTGRLQWETPGANVTTITVRTMTEYHSWLSSRVEAPPVKNMPNVKCCYE